MTRAIDPNKEGESPRLNLRLSQDLRDELDRRAEDLGIKTGELARLVLENWVKSTSKGKRK